MRDVVDTILLCDSSIESDSSQRGAGENYTNASPPSKTDGPMYEPLIPGVSQPSGHSGEFFNPREPQHVLQTEQPKHREVVILAMQGMDNKEIASRVGYSSPAVGYILKQPWALEYMSKNMHERGMGKVETLLKGAVATAVERLITEMDSPKASPAVRIAAADKILDRFYGRAAQPIIHTKGENLDNLTDAQIEQRLGELRARS